MVAILVDVFVFLCNVVITVLVVQAVMSWLLVFDVISRRNQAVDTIWRFANGLTEPLCRPIRRIIPPVSGVDLAPMALILVVIVVARLVPLVLLGRF